MSAGERIKAARLQAGLTQSQLAKKLGIPYQSIGQWERNLRNPKFETLKKIADVLGVSVARLLGGDTAELTKAGKFIEREKVLEKFREWEQECVKGDDRELFDIVRDKHVEIDDIPVADVRAERHGVWLRCDDGLYECSKCGEVAGDNFYKFCSNCGAKMDGKDEKQ